MAFPSLQISKFSGGACPQTPLAARASGARVPPYFYYPCYGTVISTNPVFRNFKVVVLRKSVNRCSFAVLGDK